MTSYQEKLLDPRWQKKRLEIFERDEWECQECFDNEATLTVHHRIYLNGKDPWDYPNEYLVTLCLECHRRETIDRKEVEELLLNELRLKFFTSSIKELAEAFHKLQFRHLVDYTASAISYAIEDSIMHKEVIDRFADYLREKRARKCQTD